jgi:5-formyltetrahydrofolate cyclo-ligase
LQDNALNHSNATPNTPPDRSVIRKSCREQAALLTLEARDQLSRGIAKRLDALLQGVSCDLSIAVYWPIHTEPDLLFHWSRLRQMGFKLALPRVVAKGRPLDFVHWDQNVELVPNEWHIPEVDHQQLALPFERIGAIVMPCVGFWASGHRLGYGGGFYDRTLAAIRQTNPSVRTIGVAFDECQVLKLRLGEGLLDTDQVCDWVVTPNQVYGAKDSGLAKA